MGFGFEYNYFNVELMYKANSADLKLKYDDSSVSYSSKSSYDVERVTLGFGYRFNF